MRQRGFEIAKGYEDKGINLPVRKTLHAAGYDVESAEDMVIVPYKPGDKPSLVPTGLKGYCMEDEYFMLVNRSSGPKKGFMKANSIGIIDADYYENVGNDGHFYFQYINISDKDLIIKKGDVIGQVIFQKFLLCDNDKCEDVVRSGGIGSTDKK